MAEKNELSVDQEIRIEAARQASIYYSIRMKLLKSSTEVFDKDTEDMVISFADKIERYIKWGKS